MVQNNYIEEFQPQPEQSPQSLQWKSPGTTFGQLGNNATFSEAKAEKLIALIKDIIMSGIQ
jgi:hypothetical protein